MEIRHVPVNEGGRGGRGGDGGGEDGGDGGRPMDASGPDERVLATDVEIAESLGEQTKGLMFREDVPADYAMVFRFDEPPWWMPDAVSNLRSIHMLFVKVPLDVIWLRAGEVQQVSTLSPWTGFGLARANTIIELPAGAADDVAVGDAVRIVDDE